MAQICTADLDAKAMYKTETPVYIQLHVLLYLAIKNDKEVWSL